MSTRRTAVPAAVALWATVACGFSDLDHSDRTCPCAEGWVCNTRNRCVESPALGGDDGFPSGQLDAGVLPDGGRVIADGGAAILGPDGNVPVLPDGGPPPNEDGGPDLPPRLTSAVEDYTTTSTVFVNVPGGLLEVDTRDSPGGWLVLLSAGLCSDSTDAPAVEARYLVNGVERGLGGVIADTPSRCGSIQHVVTLDPDSGKHDVQVQLRHATGSLARITKLRIVAVSLPEGSDLVTSETADERPITSGTPVEVRSLRWTPTTAGEYLIVGVASVSETNGSGNIFAEFVDDTSGDRWPNPAFSVPRTTWQTAFVAVRRTLSATPQTVTLRSWVGSGSTGRVRGTRLIAFRTDALRSIQSETTNQVTATGAPGALVTRLTSTPTPGVTGQLVIQSMLATVQCGLRGSRTPSFAIESDQLVLPHSIHCGYRSSYGRMVFVDSTSPLVVENRLSAGEAGNVAIATDSAIHVLGF